MYISHEIKNKTRTPNSEKRIIITNCLLTNYTQTFVCIVKKNTVVFGCNEKAKQTFA